MAVLSNPVLKVETGGNKILTSIIFQNKVYQLKKRINALLKKRNSLFLLEVKRSFFGRILRELK